ncbi:NAD(P)-dependent alcohol dehydrogenase [Kitasatospora sp. NPDC002227]|uniref:zinc-dependent alcohol dehydrogenase family protein n=1 Tax=Kitasatospora sp. NPDC002227 TaxID=3154773 RepID=UPI00331AE997
MRTYQLESPGSVEGIVARERERPAPGPTEVLVRVRAASLNRRDAMILEGSYPLPASPGVVPLSDGAGEVVAVGERVSRYRVGDRVLGAYWPRWQAGRLTPELFDQLGNTLDGMLTEYALLDEQWAVRVPEQLSWAEAATLPCAGVTAWTALTHGRPLRPGQTVLTLGSGGVSLFALQLAKAMGCRVLVTTSDPAKAGRLKALGADEVIDYTAVPEWSTAVRELTGGAGADLVVETVGARTLEQSMRSVALDGEVVLIGAGSGERYLKIEQATYARTMATLRRVFVGSRQDTEDLVRAVAGHGIHPVIDRGFDFTEARAAYEHYLGGRAFGKVVVELP